MPSNIKEEIDKYKNKKRIYYKQFSDELKNYLEIKFPNLPIEEQFYLEIHNYDKPPKCQLEGCEKKAAFNKKKKEYSKGCSSHHSSRITLQEKYGVDNPSELEATNKKRGETLQEKYGGIGFASNKIKNKADKTIESIYGVENVSQSKEIKEKVKNTFIKKYGGVGAASKEIRKKMEESTQNNYGVDNPFKSEIVKQRIKETNKEKYGCELAIQSDEVKQKAKFNFLKKSFEKIKSKLVDVVVPLFELNDYSGVSEKYKWKCVKCGNVFEDHLDNGRIPRCLRCYPIIKPNSNMENELFEKIKIPDKIKNDRTILNGKEIDIVIPSKKIAIEFDGLYWHSELNGKDRNYHLNKTIECEKKGYQLIHIFEDEWFNHEEIVLSVIHSKLNIFNEIIYARKTKVRELATKEKDEFLEKNHLQGKDNSNVKLGLFYKDELVSVMTFGKPRFNKNYQYEMHRFCSKLSTKIIGGASKLFKFFVRNYNPKSVITYADRRYSNGEFYKKIGFGLKSISKPNFFVMKDYTKREHRLKYQKYKQCKILDVYDDNLTAWQNLQLNGYDRIWDCGNYVFEWVKGRNKNNEANE